MFNSQYPHSHLQMSRGNFGGKVLTLNPGTNMILHDFHLKNGLHTLGCISFLKLLYRFFSLTTWHHITPGSKKHRAYSLGVSGHSLSTMLLIIFFILLWISSIMIHSFPFSFSFLPTMLSNILQCDKLKQTNIFLYLNTIWMAPIYIINFLSPGIFLFEIL